MTDAPKTVKAFAAAVTEEKGTFKAVIPELGLTAFGQTPQEALANLQGAVVAFFSQNQNGEFTGERLLH